MRSRATRRETPRLNLLAFFGRLMACFFGVLVTVHIGFGAEASNVVRQSQAGRSGATEVDEFHALVSQDEAAQAEIETWSKEKGRDPARKKVLDERIRERTDSVRKAYENFLSRHPHHAGAHLAYGNFLNEHEDEAGAQAHWETALALDPGNADLYNNLAGRYSETGPASKAFEYFSKAIELNPSQGVYYHNYANTLYVLNKHAMKYYGVSEQAVYAKALLQYSNACRLDPQNFSFAFDWAQTYYALKPLPTEAALRAWTNTLRSAHSEIERERVYVHLARLKMLAGLYAEARTQLTLVTNEDSRQLKTNLLRRIQEQENRVHSSNAVFRATAPKP